MRIIAVSLFLLGLILAGPASAVLVEVEIIGEIEYSGINSGPFADAGPGDPANIVFTVDSDFYVDSANYNVRGYEIEPMSFEFTWGNVTAGMQEPYPGTPYFVVRESDPVADGFYVTSWDMDWPGEIFTDVTGQLGQFAPHFEVGYDGTTLTSLDILDAAGVHNFTALTSFWYALFDDWAEAAGMIFTQLTITPVTTATEETDWSSIKALY
jgi:hypothetical protein